MTNRRSAWIVSGLGIGLCVATLAIAPGCAEDSQPIAQLPPPPPPPPPAPPAPPPVTPIEQLMVDLNIDSRVSLPEEKAPSNDVDRKAVLVFFDAFARGNSESLKGMLPLADQIELEALLKSGAWQKTVSQIQSIDIQTGAHDVNKCALAVIEVGTGARMSFQPQLWYYTTDDLSATFEAAPTPPGVMDRLSGEDWIAAWHQILDDEQQIAMLDEEMEALKQRNLEEEERETQTAEGPSQGSTGKGGARPLPPPREAPNPGGTPGGR